MTLAQDALAADLSEAIRQGDLDAVRGVLDRGQYGTLIKGDPRPVMQAVQQHDPAILRAVGHHFAGGGLWRGYAWALEQGWDEGADILMACSRAKPHDSERIFPINALCEAASAGWVKAVDRLLAEPNACESSPVQMTVANPLGQAAKRGHVALVQTLLVAFPDAHRIGLAIEEAANAQQWACLEILWPHTEAEHRAKAFEAAVYDADAAGFPRKSYAKDFPLDWLASCLTAQTFAASENQDRVQSALKEALCQVARRGCMPLLQPLLALTDPKADGSKALQWAVEAQQAEAIRALVPVSDPWAAREAWMRQKPSRWDLVDQLGPYLPAEQHKDWCRDMTRMPTMQAWKRSQEAQDLTPTSPPPRRRLRS
jgi:hypothetical protein